VGECCNRPARLSNQKGEIFSSTTKGDRMKYMIDVPEELILCFATEAISICLEEQVEALVDEVQGRLDRVEKK